RPAARDLRPGRLLALRAASAVGDRTRARPGAVRAGAEPLRHAPRSRAEDQLARPDRSRADDGRPVLRDDRSALVCPRLPVPGARVLARLDRSVHTRRAPPDARTQTLKLSLTLQSRRLYWAPRASLSLDGRIEWTRFPTSVR